MPYIIQVFMYDAVSNHAASLICNLHCCCLAGSGCHASCYMFPNSTGQFLYVKPSQFISVNELLEA